jgi:phage tail-like protein
LRFGGLNGWQKRTDPTATTLAVSDAHGLRLAAAPGGMLSLLSTDGSVGGLTLPRGMAFDRSRLLYVLGPDGKWVKRWDAEARSFVEVPEIGDEGSEPRRFQNAQSIAMAGDWLYVADTGNERVQIFDLSTLVLVDILVPGWSPVDLTSHGRNVYILDAAHGRVFRHEAMQDSSFARVLHRTDRAGQWSRIIVDRNGEPYLLNASDPSNPFLERSDPKSPPVPDAGAVRDRFETPAIRMDEKGRFVFPASLAAVCGRSLPSSPDCHPKSKPPHLVRTARGSWLLYVLRRAEQRVEAYTDGTRLRHSWGAGMDWQPADVAACGETAFVLDERNQILYRHRGGSENLKPLDLGDTSSRHWSRIACDTKGLVYLYAPGITVVQVFKFSGKPCGERFYTDVAGFFEKPCPPEPAPAGDRYFDRTGQPVQVDLSEPSGAPLYRTSGSWQSVPLSSDIYRCQWHRIELELTEFPPGSQISVSTCAHEKPEDVDPTRFVDAATIVAPLDQSICPKRSSFDFLVQSGLGKNLTVRLILKGDGFSTPIVDVARIHYPRDSYLQYLPATYSADDEGRVFLERFLAIFQTEWDALERTIVESERYFDPDAVPEGPFMEYLARQWLALSLEGDWSGQQKRRLLSAIPKIYPRRGRPDGLRDFLAVYLANVAGIETADVQSMGFPVIVEGFRERDYLFVSADASADDTSALGHGAPLWSASVKRRLQLGVYATEGEVELVSVGDPEHDLFNQYAHRFRVYMPAAWVRTSSQENTIRRALEAEKPAHTQYELCLVDAHFSVGAQSTIGLDTIIGDSPVLELACAAGTAAAPSLPPSGRLGYDAVLGPASDAGAGEFSITGKDTVLV